jgi:hypothetical protein
MGPINKTFLCGIGAGVIRKEGPGLSQSEWRNTSMTLNELIQELVRDNVGHAAISVSDVPSVRQKILAWLQDNPKQVVPLAVEMIGFKAQREIDDIEIEDHMTKRKRRA